MLTRQKGTRVKLRAPPTGRPTPELAGDRPEERRAPTRELDRPPLFFNSVGTHEFILDFGGYMSEVAHGSGTMVQCLVIMFLSFSSAPLLALALCPTLPEVCLMEDRLLHLSVLSLRHGRC